MIETDLPPPTRRSSWRGLLILSLAMALLGAAAALWLVSHWSIAREQFVGTPQVVRVPVRVPVPVATTPPAAAMPGLPAPATGPDNAALANRLGSVEARLDDVDGRVREALGDAGRAEGLLLAVAARRAIEGGMPLGYLEGLLRQRFAANHAPDVATILSAARQPVTLDELRSGLVAVAPALGSSADGSGWWSRARAELGTLVTIRRADQPTAIPAERVMLAERMVDEGHVDRALAEVSRLPARNTAAAWMTQARRYLAARSALEAIETAALLEAPVVEPRPAAPLPASPAP